MEECIRGIRRSGRLHGSGKENKDNIRDMWRGGKEKIEVGGGSQLVVWIKRGTRRLQLAVKRRAAL